MQSRISRLRIDSYELSRVGRLPAAAFCFGAGWRRTRFLARRWLPLGQGRRYPPTPLGRGMHAGMGGVCSRPRGRSQVIAAMAVAEVARLGKVVIAMCACGLYVPELTKRDFVRFVGSFRVASAQHRKTMSVGLTDAMCGPPLPSPDARACRAANWVGLRGLLVFTDQPAQERASPEMRGGELEFGRGGTSNVGRSADDASAAAGAATVQRDQHDTICRPQIRAGHLPAQYRALMSKHEQFDVFGAAVTGKLVNICNTCRRSRYSNDALTTGSSRLIQGRHRTEPHVDPATEFRAPTRSGTGRTRSERRPGRTRRLSVSRIRRPLCAAAPVP